MKQKWLVHVVLTTTEVALPGTGVTDCGEVTLARGVGIVEDGEDTLVTGGKPVWTDKTGGNVELPGKKLILQINRKSTVGLSTLTHKKILLANSDFHSICKGMIFGQF